MTLPNIIPKINFDFNRDVDDPASFEVLLRAMEAGLITKEDAQASINPPSAMRAELIEITSLNYTAPTENGWRARLILHDCDHNILRFLPHTRLDQSPAQIVVDRLLAGYIQTGSRAAMSSGVNKQTIRYGVILYKDFPMTYVASLTQAFMSKGVLHLEAPDELRNIARRQRRGL